MAYRSGLQALQDAIKAADERAKAAQSGFGSALGYFTWQPGDRKILRFLDDDVIIDKFWNFVISNTGNPITFLVDPEDPDRLKRYMSPTPGIGWKKEFKTGALVEPTTAELGVGIAVLRDEVRGEDGKLHLQDVLTDKVIDNVTLPCRQFGVVQQNPKTFWHTFATSCLARYGTICDRDFEITREGEGFNTKYAVIPLEQDPDLATVEAVQAFYFYGQPVEPEDPQRFLKCPQTLKEWAAYYGGEERYKFWLVPNDDTPAWLRASAPAAWQQQVPQQMAAAGMGTPGGGGQPHPSAAVASVGGQFTPSGMDEFHKATTSNDEAQAMQASGTSFSTLKDTLLKGAKPQQ